MRSLAVAAALILAVVAAEARTVRMVVADVDYGRVWDAAVRAVAGFPVERAGDGVIVTGWSERDPRATEVGWTRVRERVTLRVEAAGELVTRVTVDVEALGRRGDAWVPIPDTEPMARGILARLREAVG